MVPWMIWLQAFRNAFGLNYTLKDGSALMAAVAPLGTFLLVVGNYIPGEVGLMIQLFGTLAWMTVPALGVTILVLLVALAIVIFGAAVLAILFQKVFRGRVERFYWKYISPPVEYVD